VIIRTAFAALPLSPPYHLMSMRFEIITIFPSFFTSFFENGICARVAEGLCVGGVHDLRAFTRPTPHR